VVPPPVVVVVVPPVKSRHCEKPVYISTHSKVPQHPPPPVAHSPCSGIQDVVVVVGGAVVGGAVVGTGAQDPFNSKSHGQPSGHVPKEAPNPFVHGSPHSRGAGGSVVVVAGGDTQVPLPSRGKSHGHP
jgi:hypothetical protein